MTNIAHAQGDPVPPPLIPSSAGRHLSQFMQLNYQGSTPNYLSRQRSGDIRNQFETIPSTIGGGSTWQYSPPQQSGSAISRDPQPSTSGVPAPQRTGSSPDSGLSEEDYSQSPGPSSSPGSAQLAQSAGGYRGSGVYHGSGSLPNSRLFIQLDTFQRTLPSTSNQAAGSSMSLQSSAQPPTLANTFGPSFLQGFYTICNDCRQQRMASGKCYECKGYLCENCVPSHERERLTRSHHIYNFNTLANRLSPTLTGGLSQPNSQRASQANGPLGDNPQPGPSGQNPLSSRVVGAGRRSPGSSNSAHSSNRVSLSSSSTSFENLLSAAAHKRTSMELSPGHHLHTICLNDAEMETFGRYLNQTNTNLPGFTTSTPDSITPTPSITTPTPTNQAAVGSPSSSQILTGTQPGPSTSATIQEVASTSGPSSANQELASTSGQGASGDASNNMALVVPGLDLPPCPFHRQSFIFFCDSCMVPICNGCLENHSDHSMGYIAEGLSRVREIAEELRGDIRQMNLNLRQSLDGLQRMCEGIDVKAHQAAVNVKSMIRRFIAAFEAREYDLLRRVEQARQMKIRLIGYQMDNIRLHYSKLARACDLINDPNKYENDFDLMIANHQAFRELGQARNLGPTIYPCEDDGFSFRLPDESYLHSVAHIGHLHISASPLANAYRLYRQPFIYMKRMVALVDLPVPKAHSRPIYGCSELVAIKDFGRQPKKVWGKAGAAPGEFCRPWGIAMNRFGEIIVSDRSNNRIQVFDSEGNYLFHFGTQGRGPGQFDRPASIAINPNDDIVVTDKDNHRVQVFNRHGEFLLTFGERGSQIGQFLYPWDAACDSVGNILISDTRNHRIQMFQWNGIFIAKWGGDSFGGMSRLFDSPRGVTFDPAGNILVTDFNLHKIVMIERKSGKIRIIGREGNERGQFNRPQGICCDDRGWFAVADSRNYRYQVFNNKGEFMWMVGRQGKEDPGELDRPSDMCIDPEGHIHLMDFGNDRVQVF